MLFNTILKTSFLLSIIITLVGAYLKITHSADADTILTIGVIATMIFIVMAIYEVRTSTKIDIPEKTMWTIAFIFFSGLTGIVYFLSGRRRIATNP